MAFYPNPGHPLEFKTSGIKILALCPGMVNTDMINDITSNDNGMLEIGRQMTMGYIETMDKTKVLDADDVAEAALKVMMTGDPGSVWGISEKGQKPFVIEDMNTLEFWNSQMEKGQK